MEMVGVEPNCMGLGECLDAQLRIHNPCHPDLTMVVNKKMGARTRFGTPEFISTTNTLGALSST